MPTDGCAGVSEERRREVVTEQHDTGSPVSFVVGREAASEKRFHTEDLQYLRVEKCGIDDSRLALACQRCSAPGDE